MKQQPTKEQWQEVAERLDQIYGGVYLRCDGFPVFAVMERTDKNKLAIVVYVDGVIVLAWGGLGGDSPSEEARRFWRPMVRPMYQRKFIQAMEKAIGKRRCRANGYYETRTRYTPIWNRPWPFIRHLQKHNERIEILDYDTYKAEVQERQRDHVQETLTDETL